MSEKHFKLAKNVLLYTYFFTKYFYFIKRSLS